jgi:outer membrane lipase/esterase
MRFVVPAVVFLAAAPALAVDRLFVFGDSLSDVGNVDQATLGLVPGAGYFDGRFSNGPVYAEVLADGLGVGGFTHSLAGGTNYAYGGARATGTPLPNSLVVRDVDDQVDQFLGTSPTVTSDDLFVVFAGGNDLLAGNAPADVAAEIADQIARLYDAGGRSVLAPNLLPLGAAPEFNGDPAGAAAADAATQAFNASLSVELDALELARPDLDLFRLDVADLFADILLDPAAFGFTNIDEAGQSVADASGYLFWDDLHPTAAGHELLGQAALAAVPEPASLTLLGGLGVLLVRRR